MLDYSPFAWGFIDMVFHVGLQGAGFIVLQEFICKGNLIGKGHLRLYVYCILRSHFSLLVNPKY